MLTGTVTSTVKRNWSEGYLVAGRGRQLHKRTLGNEIFVRHRIRLGGGFAVYITALPPPTLAATLLVRPTLPLPQIVWYAAGAATLLVRTRGKMCVLPEAIYGDGQGLCFHPHALAAHSSPLKQLGTQLAAMIAAAGHQDGLAAMAQKISNRKQLRTFIRTLVRIAAPVAISVPTPSEKERLWEWTPTGAVSLSVKDLQLATGPPQNL